MKPFSTVDDPFQGGGWKGRISPFTTYPTFFYLGKRKVGSPQPQKPPFSPLHHLAFISRPHISPQPKLTKPKTRNRSKKSPLELSFLLSLGVASPLGLQEIAEEKEASVPSWERRGNGVGCYNTLRVSVRGTHFGFPPKKGSGGKKK